MILHCRDYGLEIQMADGMPSSKVMCPQAGVEYDSKIQLDAGSALSLLIRKDADSCTIVYITE